MNLEKCRSRDELIAVIKSMRADKRIGVHSPKEAALLVDLILIYGYSLEYAPEEYGFRRAIEQLDPFLCQHNRKELDQGYNETVDKRIIVYRNVFGGIELIEKSISIHILIGVNEGQPVYSEDIVEGFPCRLKTIVREKFSGFGYKEVISGKVTLLGKYFSNSNIAHVIAETESALNKRTIPLGSVEDSVYDFLSEFIKEKDACDYQFLKAITRMRITLQDCQKNGFPGIVVSPLGIIPMLPEFL